MHYVDSGKIFLLRLFAYTVSHLFGQIQYTLLIKSHSQTFFCSFYTNARLSNIYLAIQNLKHTKKYVYEPYYSILCCIQYSFNLTAF